MSCKSQINAKVVTSGWIWLDDEMLIELSRRGYDATTVLAHATDILKYYMESQEISEITFGDWHPFVAFVDKAITAFDEARLNTYEQAILNSNSALSLRGVPANSGEDLPPGEVTLKLTFRPAWFINDTMFDNATLVNPDAEPENY